MEKLGEAKARTPGELRIVLRWVLSQQIRQ